MIGLASKKDFVYVSIIGLIFGLFTIPVLENIRPPHWELNFYTALFLIVGFWLFANLALSIGALIGERFPGLWQFTKFGASGALNAALDVGLLNLLSLIFQIFSGPLIILFNAIAFFTAFNNSYFWNRIWVFQNGRGIDFREYFRFLAATSVGMVIGTATVYLVTTFIAAPIGISLALWENIAKAVSLPLVITANFTLYKFVVFKK